MEHAGGFDDLSLCNQLSHCEVPVMAIGYMRGYVTQKTKEICHCEVILVQRYLVSDMRMGFIDDGYWL